MTQQEINENLQFKARCILNFGNFDWDSPIYRVFPIERLTQLFTDRKNTLVKPSMWDDPFENLVFQQKATLNNGQEVNFESIRERYYGQCWTLNTKESDALWRIYSPDKNGVRVKTTLRKLFDGFYNPQYKWAMISFYIGKISYETANEIQSFFEDPDNLEMIFDTSGQWPIQTLLVKRKEFQHEDEIRLIYGGNYETDDLTQNIFHYDIDPNNLLDELLFDPRFDQTQYDNKVTEFRNFGFTKDIRKSTLYHVPNFNLRLNH